MKSQRIILLSVGFLVILVFSGCSTERVEFSKVAPSGQRVVKVSFRGQHETFRLRINQHPVEKLRNTDFTNVMARLQLDYGDIVVWEDQRDESGKELSHPKEISSWWFKHLEGVRASFYSIRSDTVSDFFTTPIYHWRGSPNKPRPLQDTMFFIDGVSLGRGSTGFQKMIATIERQKSGPVFIVAPRITNEGQASPWIADDQLLTWANGAGVYAEFEKIFHGRYTGLLDFARFGDE